MSDPRGGELMNIEWLRERVRGLPPSTGTDMALMIVDAFARLQTRCEESEAQAFHLRGLLREFVADDAFAVVDYETGSCAFCDGNSVIHTPDCLVTRARVALARETR